MRSGDLFLEVSSSKQATILLNLHKLAHLDVTVVAYGNLNFSRRVISPADFPNVPPKRYWRICEPRKYVEYGVLQYVGMDRTASNSPKKPKSPRARLRELNTPKVPKKLSNLSKKSYPILEQDLMDLHPSDDDETLMNCLPDASTSSSERGATICSPSLLPLLNFEEDNDLHNRDHFPGAGARHRPPTYNFHRADRDKFTRQAVITEELVLCREVDDAVLNVTDAIMKAADAAIPKTSNSHRKLCKPWWNSPCHQSKKELEVFSEDYGTYGQRPSHLSVGEEPMYSSISEWFPQRTMHPRQYHLTGNQNYRNAFVRRNHLVSIFFDIEKAYDRTWRYGILSTLYGYGLRGNLPCFIQNFLAARKFKVRLDGILSPSFIQAEGVPQGSILSVTFFICHISPILSQFQPSIQASLYVDDLQISCEGSDMRLIERQLQTAINKLVKWCDENGHNISASKSCYVHFCRKRVLHPDPTICIRTQIPVVPEV
ncbi:putative RNA-directed DNA polymerase from transposon X-element [Trichonephila clavipes]|nr:putative RNA-directed DNA polymerase from transposon X-element [Trichonephila clavipes]